MSSALAIVGWCCAYSFREPARQGAVSGVGFELGSGHPLEKLIQVDGFAAVDPLARCIDLAVRLDGSHDGRGCGVNLAGFLDNPFQGRADVPLPLGE